MPACRASAWCAWARPCRRPPSLGTDETAGRAWGPRRPPRGRSGPRAWLAWRAWRAWRPWSRMRSIRSADGASPPRPRCPPRAGRASGPRHPPPARWRLAPSPSPRTTRTASADGGAGGAARRWSRPRPPAGLQTRRRPARRARWSRGPEATPPPPCCYQPTRPHDCLARDRPDAGAVRSTGSRRGPRDRLPPRGRARPPRARRRPPVLHGWSDRNRNATGSERIRRRSGFSPCEERPDRTRHRGPRPRPDHRPRRIPERSWRRFARAHSSPGSCGTGGAAWTRSPPACRRQPPRGSSACFLATTCVAAPRPRRPRYLRTGFLPRPAGHSCGLPSTSGRAATKGEMGRCLPTGGSGVAAGCRPARVRVDAGVPGRPPPRARCVAHARTPRLGAGASTRDRGSGSWTGPLVPAGGRLSRHLISLGPGLVPGPGEHACCGVRVSGRRPKDSKVGARVAPGRPAEAPAGSPLLDR